MLNEAILILAAVGGSVVSGLIGWLDSGEVFVWRKFTSTLLRAILSGVVAAFGFQGQAVGVWTVGLSFLSGAGIDALGNRIAGAIAEKKVTVKEVTQ